MLRCKHKTKFTPYVLTYTQESNFLDLPCRCFLSIILFSPPSPPSKKNTTYNLVPYRSYKRLEKRATGEREGGRGLYGDFDYYDLVQHCRPGWALVILSWCWPPMTLYPAIYHPRYQRCNTLDSNTYTTPPIVYTSLMYK